MSEPSIAVSIRDWSNNRNVSNTRSTTLAANESTLRDGKSGVVKSTIHCALTGVVVVASAAVRIPTRLPTDDEVRDLQTTLGEATFSPLRLTQVLQPVDGLSFASPAAAAAYLMVFQTQTNIGVAELIDMIVTLYGVKNRVIFDKQVVNLLNQYADNQSLAVKPFTVLSHEFGYSLPRVVADYIAKRTKSPSRKRKREDEDEDYNNEENDEENDEEQDDDDDDEDEEEAPPPPKRQRAPTTRKPRAPAKRKQVQARPPPPPPKPMQRMPSPPRAAPVPPPPPPVPVERTPPPPLPQRQVARSTPPPRPMERTPTRVGDLTPPVDFNVKNIRTKMTARLPPPPQPSPPRHQLSRKDQKEMASVLARLRAPKEPHVEPLFGEEFHRTIDMMEEYLGRATDDDVFGGQI